MQANRCIFALSVAFLCQALRRRKYATIILWFKNANFVIFQDIYIYIYYANKDRHMLKANISHHTRNYRCYQRYNIIIKAISI